MSVLCDIVFEQHLCRIPLCDRLSDILTFVVAIMC